MLDINSPNFSHY